MTTNNLTEHMHKMVEARRSGTQTVVSFIERLYGIKILRDSLVQNELGETLFNTGLVTYWNMHTIEHKQFPHKKPIDENVESTKVAELTKKIDAMITKLVNCNDINIPANYYLVNMLSGECTCYDYIWRSSYHDICKHVYAARLYIELLHKRLQVQDVKQSLVKHFK
ncbi:28778_t:CDS:2, partial [Racocetra persica]